MIFAAVVVDVVGTFVDAVYSKVMQEFPPLLNESDLHIAQLTLMLLTSIGVDYKTALTGIENTGVLGEVKNLLRSPLLQGPSVFFLSPRF